MPSEELHQALSLFLRILENKSLGLYDSRDSLVLQVFLGSLVTHIRAYDRDNPET